MLLVSLTVVTCGWHVMSLVDHTTATVAKLHVWCMQLVAACAILWMGVDNKAGPQYLCSWVDHKRGMTWAHVLYACWGSCVWWCIPSVLVAQQQLCLSALQTARSYMPYDLQ
jgi:hypothetical protein